MLLLPADQIVCGTAIPPAACCLRPGLRDRCESRIIVCTVDIKAEPVIDERWFSFVLHCSTPLRSACTQLGYRCLRNWVYLDLCQFSVQAQWAVVLQGQQGSKPSTSPQTAASSTGAQQPKHDRRSCSSTHHARRTPPTSTPPAYTRDSDIRIQLTD